LSEYPEEADLKRIREWPLGDLFGLAEFVGSIWHWPDWGYKITGKRVKRMQLHTGGWSGNESIIEALEQTTFWMVCWTRTDRGGHYYFVIRPWPKKKR
jgi:hypothetical protein